MTGDLNFGDNDKAVFGAGDLEIYHDGSASYVQQTGAGPLNIQRDVTSGSISSGSALLNILTKTGPSLHTAANLSIHQPGSTEGVGDFRFSVGNGAGVSTEILRVDSTGVDITGTLTSEGLHVRDNNAVVIIDDANNGVTGTTYKPHQEFWANGTRVGSIGMTDSSNLEIIADDYNSASINFDTGGSEAMRITSTGAVGIGTSSPDRQLSVQNSSAATFALKTTKLSNAGDEEYSFGEFDFLGTDKLGALVNPIPVARIAARANTGSSVPGGELAFYTNASGSNQTQNPNEAMRISSGGNVGIGTSSPDADSILDVQSTTKGVRFPNMTTAQKNAMGDVAGNMVFDTTLGKMCFNTGSSWETITST